MPATRHAALTLALIAVVVAMTTACSPATPISSPASTAAGRPASTTPGRPPAPPSPTKPVTSSAAAPSVTRPAREPGPDLLHDHTQAGAEAYLEDYLHRLDAAWTTAQPALLDNRATKKCGTCTNFRDAAAAFMRKGQRHEAPMLVVSDVSIVIWRPDVRVVADLRQPDHDIVDTAGRRVERVKGGRAYLYVVLTYSGRWWITGIAIDPVNDDGTHRER